MSQVLGGGDAGGGATGLPRLLSLTLQPISCFVTVVVLTTVKMESVVVEAEPREEGVEPTTSSLIFSLSATHD